MPLLLNIFCLNLILRTAIVHTETSKQRNQNIYTLLVIDFRALRGLVKARLWI